MGLGQTNRTARFWAGIVAINAAASLLAVVAFSGVTWHTPWRDILGGTAISFLFSICCSSLCIVALPHLVPFARRWVPFPLNWAVIVLALIGCAAAGSLLALFILAGLGFIPTSRVFVAWFGGSLKVSIIVTLVFGLFGTIVETMRARLDAATLALRTKERDEADARRVAAEAQLASLESRVQPHFLFNTLNSIAALIHEDPAGAERMTAQLASLLRSSLDQRSPLVSLDDELRTVRNYLDIERVRFGDRLRYDIQVDEAVRHVSVPQLAVQTLVENSVKYAVSPRREGASIAVRAALTNGHVRIEVEDDGPGFDATATPEGHGLALVRERLAMALGDRASLHIDATPGRSRVGIDVPVRLTAFAEATAVKKPDATDA